MKNNSLPAAFALGITLAIGIAISGYFIGNAFYEIRASERYVSVKGLAERNVPADLAIWPLSFTETGNDLTAIQNKLDFARKTILAYLTNRGFKETEISESPPRITDYHAQGYTGQEPRNRYRADGTITLRSTDAPLVRAAMGQSGELVKKGIVLASNYGQGTEFLFTGLNEIKPEMIARATENARQAAEQFAKDSDSKVGAIRRARQGQFTIRNRDMNTPELKIVRVVTTLEYFLVEE